MKVYLTAGHQVVNGKGTGAHSLYGDEAVLALRLRNDITSLLAARGVTVFNDPPADTLTKVIEWLRTSTVSDRDLVIDLHFNSAASAAAKGTEVIIPEKYTRKELDLGIAMAKAVSDSLGTTLRRGKLIHTGVKTEGETAHKSIGILNKPYKATNILVEVCFLSNYDEMTNLFPTNYRKLVSSIADVVCKHA